MLGGERKRALVVSKRALKVWCEKAFQLLIVPSALIWLSVLTKVNVHQWDDFFGAIKPPGQALYFYLGVAAPQMKTLIISCFERTGTSLKIVLGQVAVKN